MPYDDSEDDSGQGVALLEDQTPQNPYGDQTFAPPRPVAADENQTADELPPLPANIQPHEWKYIQQALQLRNQMKFRAEQAAAAKYKSEEDAIRFQGQQEYNDLLNQGASVQEAFRRAAPKLYYHNPLKQADAMARMPGTAPSSLTATVIRHPDTGEEVGLATINPRSGAVQASRFNAAKKMPGDVEETLKIYHEDASDLRRDIRENKKALAKYSADDPEAKAAKAVLPDLQQQLKELEQKIVFTKTNWMGAASAPASAKSPAPVPTVPYKEGAKIRKISDGKIYKVVNGIPVLQE